MDADVELKALIERIKGMASREVMPAITKSLAAEAIGRIKSCFDRSQDPYGAVWDPLVSRQGSPLVDSRRLRNAFQDNSRAGQVEIHNPTKYAAVHNYGSKGLPRGKITPKNAKALAFKAFGVDVFSKGVTIPARPFLPDNSRGLPAEWIQRFTKVLTGYITRRLTGKAWRSDVQ